MTTAMKAIAILLLAGSCAAVAEQDRTITKVVKLLQGMLDKSVKEGDEERKIYAKFKCYCDQSEASKKDRIEDNKDTIALLESQIEEIQGGTGGLSSDCADLKEKMAENEKARKEAQSLRDKEEKAFDDTVADLTQGIKQMKAALETLAAVGADQTKSTGADNKQFMAKAALLQDVQDQVGHALRAATGLMNAKQQESATAFLQAPFTGTYTSQSAVVMGILKSMRDTFEKNLDDAKVTEKNAIEAHKKFMDLKKDAYDDMSDDYDAKQKLLGGNDGDLSTKRGQLADAQKQLASDEEFLDKLLPMCEKKAESYGIRKELRAQEEAAIAQAISILNSDDAFATFGTTDATTTGFLQLRAVHRHVQGNTRLAAQTLLTKAAKDANSARLSKVVSLLRANNPFEAVLGEIDKMLELIKEESKADTENLNWCNDERKENDATLKKKNKEILGLKSKENSLTDKIENPKTGLKKQIADTEDDLRTNDASQKEETKDRTEKNLAYQQDVKNLVSAQGILKKAIKVLKAYYDDLEEKLAAGEAGFLQKSHHGLKREDPAAPDTWKGGFEGQSGQGNEVLKMLDFIESETNEEEMAAHSQEEKEQADYEDSMTSLKKEQADSEKLLAKLEKSLAETEAELLATKEDLAQTTKDRDAVEDYLEKIKPGCDFITKNYDLRERNRDTESSALKKAIGLIKGTPAYKTFKSEERVEGFGDCKSCDKDEDHVKCKACMADVTVPAYCAGHKGTKGC